MDILNNNIITWGLLIFVFIGLTLNFFNTRRIKKRLKIFFNGSRAQDLEEVLAQELKKIRNLEETLKKLTEEHKNTKGIALTSIHKIGVVRFNPFNNVGGDQSFAIALLDAKNNGVILSSLFTREGTRVYAKPISGGGSKYTLSNEEKEALAKAIEFKNRI